MDPNANLKEQLQLASRITEAYEHDQHPSALDVARLVELVLALDQWLRKGGFPPAAWSKEG